MHPRIQYKNCPVRAVLQLPREAGIGPVAATALLMGAAAAQQLRPIQSQQQPNLRPVPDAVGARRLSIPPAIKPSTIGSLITNIMEQCGIDTSKFKAHILRSASMRAAVDAAGQLGTR